MPTRVLLPAYSPPTKSECSIDCCLAAATAGKPRRSPRGFIRTLTSGIVPEGTASTAAVKPSIEATAAVLDADEKSCDALLAAVAAAPNLKTAARYAHPWFGPLDAAGWHALAGGHLGIHRVQIERILEGLRSAKE